VSPPVTTARATAAPFVDELLADYRPSMRPLIESTITALIEFLDAIDGDEHLEPELGWTLHGAFGGADDREDDPSHGALENPAWQAAQLRRPTKHLRRAA